MPLICSRRALLAMLPAAAARSATGAWKPMFDGKSLGQWKATPFTGAGKVTVADGAIVLAPGTPMTGITWTGEFPKVDYEIRWEAVRKQGSDFFATLTFPVGDSFASFVTGGWGGDIVGISNIDGWDASDNQTRTYENFENGRWYVFRLQVTAKRIRAWIDEKASVDVEIEGREIGLREGEIKLSAPLGFAAFLTLAAVRRVEFRMPG